MEREPMMAQERNMECNKPSKHVGPRRVPARPGHERNDNAPVHQRSHGAHGDESDNAA